MTNRATDATGSPRARIRLGLIGDNIRTSRSPALHRFCGQLCGLDVSYDLLLPPDLGEDFETLFERCREEGLRGVNVTLPYKERVISLVRVEDPLIARIGAVNTVVLDQAGPRGYNTDYSGFVAAYRAAFGAIKPGRVAVVGAGGVGKAIGFGLIALGAEEIRFVDQDRAKADALAAATRAAGGAETATIAVPEVAAAIAGADGVVNCTPVGMIGYPGSPLPDGSLSEQTWGFDAVYTPIETRFKAQIEAIGARFVSGYELFFHQGVEAFEIFTGVRPADLQALRDMLAVGAAAHRGAEQSS